MFINAITRARAAPLVSCAGPHAKNSAAGARRRLIGAAAGRLSSPVAFERRPTGGVGFRRDAWEHFGGTWGSVDTRVRMNSRVPRGEHGATLANLLLPGVASDWQSCFDAVLPWSPCAGASTRLVIRTSCGSPVSLQSHSVNQCHQ